MLFVVSIWEPITPDICYLVCYALALIECDCCCGCSTEYLPKNQLSKAASFLLFTVKCYTCAKSASLVLTVFADKTELLTSYYWKCFCCLAVHITVVVLVYFIISCLKFYVDTW